MLTTENERQGARQFCLAILKRPENQTFPDMAVVKLNATRVIALLDDFDELLRRLEKEKQDSITMGAR